MKVTNVLLFYKNIILVINFRINFQLYLKNKFFIRVTFLLTGWCCWYVDDNFSGVCLYQKYKLCNVPHEITEQTQLFHKTRMHDAIVHYPHLWRMHADRKMHFKHKPSWRTLVQWRLFLSEQIRRSSLETKSRDSPFS